MTKALAFIVLSALSFAAVLLLSGCGHVQVQWNGTAAGWNLERDPKTGEPVRCRKLYEGFRWTGKEEGLRAWKLGEEIPLEACGVRTAAVVAAAEAAGKVELDKREAELIKAVNERNRLSAEVERYRSLERAAAMAVPAKPAEPVATP